MTELACKVCGRIVPDDLAEEILDAFAEADESDFDVYAHILCPECQEPN